MSRQRALAAQKRLQARRHKLPLKLFWWRHLYPYSLNFGDELTAKLINKLFGRTVEWAPIGKASMAGAGSIMEVLLEDSKKNKLAVWGSGFIEDGKPKLSNASLDVYAVRGRMSSDRLSEKGLRDFVGLGDPGMLTSLAWPKRQAKQYAVGFIPHYVDHDHEFVRKFTEAGAHFINPLFPPELVIEEIKKCETIISSSLHGLILADSYKIPNQRIAITGLLTGGDYKFNDYYSIFDAQDRKVLHIDDIKGSIEEIAAAVSDQYNKPHNLDYIQRSLIKSYPNI